jgi:hypothetical protein
VFRGITRTANLRNPLYVHTITTSVRVWIFSVQWLVTENRDWAQPQCCGTGLCLRGDWQEKEGSRCVEQWFPTSGRDPNQARGSSDLGSREGFMENSIIMYELFKQRFVCYMFYVFDIVPKILDLTSNIRNLIFFEQVVMLCSVQDKTLVSVHLQ